MQTSSNLQSTKELIIETGSAYVYYAFDIGNSIDLVKAEQLLSAERVKPRDHEKKRQAKYFEFTPPPVRWISDAPVCELGSDFRTLMRIEMLFFDYGCVSVRFEIPIEGPISRIIDLSVNLYENQKMQEAARSLVEKAIGTIGKAVDRMSIAPRTEDYCIFHFAKIDPVLSVEELLAQHITSLACVLRAEKSQPSDREVKEFLQERISYGSKDFTLTSWHGAVIYAEEAEDIYAVLEFTNSVLMELSYLDLILDRALDNFYELFTKRERGFRIFGSRARPLMRRISQLQIESAILFERVTNAIKLMGDDFQARVYQQATRKMGLPSWNASITKKLETLESLYSKLSETEGTRRMEVLEVIIIILILISIFVSAH